MDNLQQGCCSIFYFLPSSTKGIFLKSTEFHYMRNLWSHLPCIVSLDNQLPGIIQSSRKSINQCGLGGLDPPFITVAMKAFWLHLQKSSRNCGASVLGFKNKVILHYKIKLGWIKLNRSYLMVSQDSLLSACFYISWTLWPKVFHPVRADEWPL